MYIITLVYYSSFHVIFHYPYNLYIYWHTGGRYLEGQGDLVSR